MALRFNGNMYALGLPHEIGIERTDDDSCVFGLFHVEMDEVFAIKGENDSIAGKGKSRNRFVRHGQPRVTSFLRRQDIVPHSFEFLNDRQRKILVRIELRHASNSLILTDFAPDFLLVRSHIGPCICEVLRAQRGIRLQ
jgi:hypothetical protein